MSTILKAVQPENYGAKGDGITDDRQALINTFEYAIANRLTVDLSDGLIYLIDSLTPGGCIFNVTGSLKIKGHSTIKIGAVGDYENVFNIVGGNNVIFQDFTLDSNTTNNPMTISTGKFPNSRIDFYANNLINKLQFKNVTIKDSLGVWQIFANATTALIDQCTIKYATAGKPQYDRTCLFMSGSYWTVRNNNFIGSSIANTCLEIHGANFVVDGNTVQNFTNSLLLENDNPINNVNVMNNTFITTAGMQLWFDIDNNNVGNVIIHNNIIDIIGESFGISTSTTCGSNVTINNVKISSNTFNSIAKTNDFIDLYTQTGTNNGLVYNYIFIENNTFTGTANYAVKLYSQNTPYQIFKYVEFKNNTFDISTLYSSGLIFMVDTPVAFQNINFINNTFNVSALNSGSQIYAINAWYDTGRPGIYGNLKMRNNNYIVPIGITFLYSNLEANLVLDVVENLKYDIQDIYFNAGLYVQVGSITDMSDQWIFFSAGQMIAKKFKGTSFPTAGGNWIQGDVIYNTNPTNGGYAGWVCVVSGSPGTWKGFGLIDN
jgi:hypothetical protein